MDVNFSSITDIYNKYLSDAASKETSSLSKLNGAKDYSKATDDELMKVCKQFEAYFLEQCFKEMTKTVGTEEFSSGATSTLVDYYKDNLIQKIASDSTEQNSLGLAQMLYEQMKRNYNL
ncbi:MAG: rod-binding protein [Lachnospiraceae bacterium]|nr:rod-binding protein [Lachnospiraceae bacterium]